RDAHRAAGCPRCGRASAATRSARNSARSAPSLRWRGPLRRSDIQPAFFACSYSRYRSYIGCHRIWSKTMTQALTRTRLTVEGMDCASCAAKIETAAKRTAGIADATVSVAAGTVVLDHEAGADIEDFRRRSAAMGYKTSPAAAPSPTAPRPVERAWWQGGKARLTLACAIALALAFIAEQFIPALHPWGFVAAVLVGLVPIAGRALSAARNGSPFTIETLMTVAAIGALLIDASAEAAVVVVLFLVGEMLEGLAAGRARASIRALADLVPRNALREHDNHTHEIPADDLEIGDTILVRPGDRIAADGEILSGESAINEAPVTGE